MRNNNIRIVHTADIHFGMENYGRIDPIRGIHSRLIDFQKSFNECIDYAISENVDAFVLAGDAYKNAHPTPTHQKLLITALHRLAQAQIPVILTVGNHDHPLSFGKAHALSVTPYLTHEYIHLLDTLCVKTVTTKNGPLRVLGLPWPNKSIIHLTQQAQNNAHDSHTIMREVILQRAHELLSTGPAIPTIVVGHITISTGVFSGSEKQAITGNDVYFNPQDLVLPGVQYVALGHLHRHQNLGEKNGVPVVYSGSLERIDFGEWRDTKGFCVVEIPAEQKPASYSFIPVTTRPMVYIRGHLQSHTPEEQTAELSKVVMQHDCTNAIVKIRYTLESGAEDLVNKREIQQLCKDAWYVASIVGIKDKMVRMQQRITTTPETNALQSPMTLLKDYCVLKKYDTALQESILKKALAIIESTDTRS